MARQEIARKQQKEKADDKRHIRRPESQPQSGHLRMSLGRTQFRPRIKEHVGLLRSAYSGERLVGLVSQLQRTYGNRYVSGLLRLSAAQAKLIVSNPQDTYEREADRVADQVVGTINRQVPGKPEEEEVEVQTKIQRRPEATAQMQQADEEEEQVQTQSTGRQKMGVSGNLEKRINAATGSGQSLPAIVREPMENAMGADFNGVRIHTDSNANALSQSLQARAFTIQKDIFFKNGEFDPASKAGQKLIAHELTHTMQQGAGRRVSRWFANGHELLTREAALKLQGSIPIDDKLIDFLAKRSGDLDATPRSVKNLIGGTLKSGKLRKKYKKDELLQDLRIKKQLWDLNSTHVRNTAELPLHGEAGYYKKDHQAGMVDANKKGVSKQAMEAIANFNAGKQKEALMKLSYALHSAEDRGAHGEGREFKGHDPRISKEEFKEMPSLQGMVPNPYFNPNWNPDDPTMNSEGWKLGETYAEEVLLLYHSNIKTKSKKDPLASLDLTSKEAKWREHGMLASVMNSNSILGIKLPGGKVAGGLLSQMQKLMRQISKLKTEIASLKEKQNTVKEQLGNLPSSGSFRQRNKLGVEYAKLYKKISEKQATMDNKTRQLERIKEQIEKLKQEKGKQLNTPELKFPTERQYE